MLREHQDKTNRRQPRELAGERLPMPSIAYRVGDATQPVGDGPKILVHVCNDIGAWGRGFVVALSRRWANLNGTIAPGIAAKTICHSS